MSHAETGSSYLYLNASRRIKEGIRLRLRDYAIQSRTLHEYDQYRFESVEPAKLLKPYAIVTRAHLCPIMARLTTVMPAHILKSCTHNVFHSYLVSRNESR